MRHLQSRLYGVAFINVLVLTHSKRHHNLHLDLTVICLHTGCFDGPRSGKNGIGRRRVLR